MRLQKCFDLGMLLLIAVLVTGCSSSNQITSGTVVQTSDEEDSKRTGSLKSEGEAFELSIEKMHLLENSCAEGLTPTAKANPSNEGCEYPKENAYVCVICPDGSCGKGENKCNCPQDCR